jgi:hypothetical protein
MRKGRRYFRLSTSPECWSLTTIAELRQIPILNEASFLKSGPAKVLLSLHQQQFELLLRYIYARNPELQLEWPDVDVKPFAAILPDLDLSVLGYEGQIKLVHHFIRERDRSIIDWKKQYVLQKKGRLACEVCTFDFGEVYGSRGHEFCEVHHL